SEETARQMDEWGIAVRAGLHCAPAAHKAMGTLTTGTVRIAPSAFTAAADWEKLIKFFRQSEKIRRNPLQKA
ncbi:MAG: cysteine desulfurase, partial [Acutalibacteraceae bacterium]